jgi:hypothetical protein
MPVRWVSLRPSPRTPKKWVAVFEIDGNRTKTIHFGDRNYDDFTQHNDPNRRRLYRLRHQRVLATTDPLSPSHLAYYVLWGDSTDLQTNARAFAKKFGIIKAF